MSSCSKCKAELPDGARFCNKCGTPQIAAPANKEETPKTTPAETPKTPIVSPLRTIQPDTKHTPQPRAASHNTSSAATATTLKEVPEEIPAPQVVNDKTTTNKLESLEQPDISQAPTGPVTPPEQQKKPGVIVITSSQATQEPARRKAAPGLIRPIGAAATPKPPAHPAPSIPRRPGQPAHSTATPIAKTAQPQGLPKGAHTPPQAFLESQQLADQVKQLEPAPSAPQEHAEKGWLPPREKTVRNATPQARISSPIENLPTGHLPRGIVQAKPTEANAAATAGRSRESLDATSRVAEHWRNSWRDRQRAEAGPIVDVSRGDASVPMPLMAMQQSLVRLRAMVTSNKQKQQERGINLTFWVTILLMVCLIGGLAVYVISTYLPNSLFGAAHIAPPPAIEQPTLTIQGSQLTTLEPGQTVDLHGEHFGANDTITFFLDTDTVTPITNAKGKPLTAQASNRGSFDVALLVGNDWLAGAHLISAQDTRTGQNAYLNIEVSIAGTPVTTSNKLALSVTNVMFKAVIGQGNPDQQRVTLTNISGAPLQWVATASVDNSLSWLVIDDNYTSGSLDINGIDSIGISVLATDLASSPMPYKGQIVFIINGKEQLTLPVELQVVDAQAEIIFSPNPLTGIVNPANGTCQSGATLTLINLGNDVITWSLKPDNLAQSHISFTFRSNGKPANHGQLLPAGTSEDTQVLTLQCTNVHAGDTYHVELYANGLQWSVLVLIRTSS